MASEELLNTRQIADLLGIAPLSVEALVRRRMPVAQVGDEGAGYGGPADPSSWRVTRRELAARWKVHADTISKWMPEGLGAAVLERKARGEVIFDLRVATRWHLAYTGQLNSQTLIDFETCAAAGVFAWHALPITDALANKDTTNE